MGRRGGPILRTPRLQRLPSLAGHIDLVNRPLRYFLPVTAQLIRDSHMAVLFHQPLHILLSYMEIHKKAMSPILDLRMERLFTFRRLISQRSPLHKDISNRIQISLAMIISNPTTLHPRQDGSLKAPIIRSHLLCHLVSEITFSIFDQFVQFLRRQKVHLRQPHMPTQALCNRHFQVLRLVPGRLGSPSALLTRLRGGKRGNSLNLELPVSALCMFP